MKTILVVDDEEQYFDIYSLKLEALNWIKLIYASSGLQAILELQKSKVDLIIADIDMPDGDGMWLLSEVRKFFPTIPIIVSSGSVLSSEEDVLLKGANAFIDKLDISKLDKTCRSLLVKHP